MKGWLLLLAAVLSITATNAASRKSIVPANAEPIPANVEGNRCNVNSWPHFTTDLHPA
jgi:hypothetical protein